MREVLADLAPDLTSLRSSIQTLRQHMQTLALSVGHGNAVG
jgi:hypothetical protein